MGYTHYWYQTQDCPPELWQRICTQVRHALTYTTIPFVAALEGIRPDDISAITGQDVLCFNGEEPDDFETFVLCQTRGDIPRWQTNPEQGVFNCCKTGHRPYDTLVCMVLAMAEQVAPEVYRLKSDGGLADWLEPLKELNTLQSVMAGAPQPFYYPRFLREQLLDALIQSELTPEQKRLLETDPT